MLNEINVLELNEKLNLNKSLILLDVRESYELNICKIDNSVHIPMADIPKRINQLNKNEEIIILCRSGVRSKRVYQFLYNQGFTKIKNLKGGILEWIRLVNPLLKSY